MELLGLPLRACGAAVLRRLWNCGIGTIGTPTTINSGDMPRILMIAVQALEKQNREMKAENAGLKARLERLEKLVHARETLAQK